jgi:hypothetical protein
MREPPMIATRRTLEPASMMVFSWNGSRGDESGLRGGSMAVAQASVCRFGAVTLPGPAAH